MRSGMMSRAVHGPAHSSLKDRRVPDRRTAATSAARRTVSPIRSTRPAVLGVAVGALVAGGLVTTAAPAAAAPSDARITEIHYDNAGADSGEAVEVTAPTAADLTGLSLVLYNGNVPTAATTYGSVAQVPASSTGIAVVTYPATASRTARPTASPWSPPTAPSSSSSPTRASSRRPTAGRRLTSTDIGVARDRHRARRAVAAAGRRQLDRPARRHLRQPQRRRRRGRRPEPRARPATPPRADRRGGRAPARHHAAGRPAGDRPRQPSSPTCRPAASTASTSRTPATATGHLRRRLRLRPRWARRSTSATSSP